MSIQPKWVEKILSGEKTIEVRKTAPKEVPFKVYVYCTKTMPHNRRLWASKRNYYYIDDRCHNLFDYELNGKVVAEFICNKVSVYDSAFYEWASSVAPSDVYCTIEGLSDSQFYKLAENEAKLTDDDIINYFGDEDFVASLLHISDLKIYDTPKELGEFKRPCIVPEMPYCPSCRYGCTTFPEDTTKQDLIDGCECEWGCLNTVTRPPQNYIYVEEL